ncbi:MAG: hypothetical protein CM15mP13_1190 [Pseudomonadota bacterium]|nr:MAG: hypothetical protein CM15mP13_1190 [Pseudomonadota bacterium]
MDSAAVLFLRKEGKRARERGGKELKLPRSGIHIR